jgi:hypothetical protein
LRPFNPYPRFTLWALDSPNTSDIQAHAIDLDETLADKDAGKLK